MMKTRKYLITVLPALLIIGVSHAQLPSYLPTNGLVAWYPFNGNANDESGNGNDGVVHGATLCADKVANASSAYDFSGADSYIEIASSPIQSQGSLMAWVFPRSAAAVNNNWDYSASLIDQNIDAQNNSGIGLYYHNTIHGLYAEIGWSGNSNNFINANPIQPLALADWQQVVFTFSQGSCSLYLNGELIATKNNMNAAGLGTAHLFLGRAPWGGNQFNGILDDIAIYNRALTPTEVTALFTASPTNNGGGTTSTNPAPPGIPYQAEVRNENGEVLANSNVNVRFTLHEQTANGTVSYQETHAITTNELGLFAATIGAGTAAQGTFAGINWSQTTKFLQVEVDAGNGYFTMGNQQLMSVPYAFYAANGPQGPAGLQGEPGINGMNGNNGFNSLIRSSTSNLDSLCSNGVVIIESGLDINRNGVLENSEVNPSQSNQICFNAPTNAGFQGKRIGFSTSGNWTCPSGVYQITVELWGAGGACNSQVTGGTGGYTRSLISVVPETNYNIQIGLGGVGSTGISGGSSNFNGILEAPGGSGACNGCYYEPATNGAVTNWPYSNINSPNYIPSSWFNVPTLAPGGQINCFSCPNHVRGSDGFCIITY